MTLLINYTEPTMAEPTEEAIRERAYQLWLSEGKPDGREVDHWLAARQALLHEELERKQALENIGSDGTRPLRATVRLKGSRAGQSIRLNAAASGVHSGAVVTTGNQPRTHTRSHQPV